MLNFMPFTFKRLSIPDVILVEPSLFSDDRGFFFESFKESDFFSNGIDKNFVQDNFSHSVNGVIRGLHFQKAPKAQAKLVTVLKGKIFDVAVDIRKNSPTYGKWVSEILSDDTHNLLYVPEGFAHGFCVISDEADVLYKVSNEYSQEHERSIIWNDPKLNIQWPITKPIISNKDNKLSLLENLDNDFVYRDQS
uniref:dTDP-4-dehydrorhamnose 3,5-epimerase n=1 Tax=uncultured marine thaumarchaeote KM3_74_H09 TaxID=1456276 RepID=A0A075HQW7_9ARCH|nr:dTDP-4-dehydrorhamnose 3,5-epimerase (rfbC) [uncultured marine thaumarchaeote KM3_74_H09]